MPLTPSCTPRWPTPWPPAAPVVALESTIFSTLGLPRPGQPRGARAVPRRRPGGRRGPRGHRRARRRPPGGRRRRGARPHLRAGAQGGRARPGRRGRRRRGRTAPPRSRPRWPWPTRPASGCSPPVASAASTAGRRSPATSPPTSTPSPTTRSSPCARAPRPSSTCPARSSTWRRPACRCSAGATTGSRPSTPGRRACPCPHRVESAEAVAAVLAHRARADAGVLLAVPIPEERRPRRRRPRPRPRRRPGRRRGQQHHRRGGDARSCSGASARPRPGRASPPTWRWPRTTPGGGRGGRRAIARPGEPGAPVRPRRVVVIGAGS